MPCLDDFRVRVSNETAGTRMYRTGDVLVLHNDADPCASARQLAHPTSLRLGAEVAPRPELKRFCKRCSWPAPRDVLLDALKRIPDAYR